MRFGYVIRSRYSIDVVSLGATPQSMGKTNRYKNNTVWQVWSKSVNPCGMPFLPTLCFSDNRIKVYAYTQRVRVDGSYKGHFRLHLKLQSMFPGY